jgi:hypothetical protein
MDGHRDRQGNRPTYRLINRQMHEKREKTNWLRETGRQNDRETATGIQTDRQTVRRTDRQAADRHAGRLVDRRTDKTIHTERTKMNT